MGCELRSPLRIGSLNQTEWCANDTAHQASGPAPKVVACVCVGRRTEARLRFSLHPWLLQHRLRGEVVTEAVTTTPHSSYRKMAGEDPGPRARFVGQLSRPPLCRTTQGLERVESSGAGLGSIERPESQVASPILAANSTSPNDQPRHPTEGRRVPIVPLFGIGVPGQGCDGLTESSHRSVGQGELPRARRLN